MTTIKRDCHPYLDDPIAFAHELYSLLAAGGDGRVVGGEVKAYKPFNAAVAEMCSALEREELPAKEQLLTTLDTIDELAIVLASSEHSRGVEFGVHAELLRRCMLDGAKGPRIPWK